MTAADDMKAAFDNHHEAYRQGYLAGARAMQEAAARILDDYATRRDRIAAIQDQQGRYGYSAENLAEAEQHRRTAAAIRALDPEKVGE